MKVIAITQARTGSTRLPNKVLLKVQDKTLLQIHIDRIRESKLINSIHIATTTKKSDDAIEHLAKQLKVDYYRGSEEDVLDRFYQTVKDIKPDYIVRLTSDCPLIDPQLLDEVIEEAITKRYDYYANIIEELYPDGQDIEVFTFKALETAWKQAKLQSEREHVTPYIRNNSTYKGGNMFTSENHGLNQSYNNVRLTVDEPKDLEVITKIISNLGLNKDWKTYAKYYIDNKEVSSLNSTITRNEGYLKSVKND